MPEENSRDALFDSMKKRETYATSGPRIEVRFFGGWNYPDNLCNESDFADVGYQQGVPMGGELPMRPQGAIAPKFAVMAKRDSDLADKPGTKLQRIQIIKGWLSSDKQLNQKVYDVAGYPHNGASVNLYTCETIGEGADSLCTVWTDPDFDPTPPAFYYVRVVQNPTCRWSTYECLRLSPEKCPESCDDPGIPKVVQERAWTSPIWYTL